MICFTHMWNKTNEQRKNKTKQNKTKRERERETNQETDSTIENKLMVTIGEVGGGMGEIGDKD